MCLYRNESTHGADLSQCYDNLTSTMGNCLLRSFKALCMFTLKAPRFWLITVSLPFPCPCRAPSSSVPELLGCAGTGVSSQTGPTVTNFGKYHVLTFTNRKKLNKWPLREPINDIQLTQIHIRTFSVRTTQGCPPIYVSVVSPAVQSGTSQMT